jgi:hypothetical protein
LKSKESKPITAALKREINAELGAEIEVKGLFMPTFDFNYSMKKHGIEANTRLWPFKCHLTESSPEPISMENVHSLIEWFPARAYGCLKLFMSTK